VMKMKVLIRTPLSCTCAVREPNRLWLHFAWDEIFVAL
jgi:hypothetical protein